jgi:hypothetical protein
VRPRGDQLRVDAGGELREPLGARDRIVERGLSDLGLDEKTKLGSDRGIWPDYRNGGKAGVSASEPRGLHFARSRSAAQLLGGSAEPTCRKRGVQDANTRNRM